MIDIRKKITGYTIHLDNQLGEGAFGKVYVGQDDKTKRRVAIKVLEKKVIDTDDYKKMAFFSQIVILKALKSPNIVGFLDVMQSANKYYIIQELCNGGELRKIIKKAGKMPEADAIGYLRQICNGFLELLRQGVMHRDLKPQNILIHDNVLKIADFGLSKKHQDKSTVVQTSCGTPLYMSPQVLRGKAYSSKCDIWSVGCIFYEMLEGKTPWPASTAVELLVNIESKPIAFSRQYSAKTKDFIKRCLANQEKNRLSWDQCLRHEIFGGYFNKNQADYQNKFKLIMNNLRYMVKVNSIDIDKLFVKLGCTSLSITNFKQLMLCIDDELTDEEISYTFKKMDENGSGMISHSEFSKAATKFDIPMNNGKKNNEGQGNTTGLNEIPKKDVVNQQQVSSKYLNALYQLLKRLKEKKTTIYQILEAYKCTQKGFIELLDLGKIIQIADKTFTEEQLRIVFNMMDTQGHKRIPCQTFIKYFYDATNSMKNGKSDTNPLQKKLSLEEPKYGSQNQNGMSQSLPGRNQFFSNPNNGGGQNLMNIMANQLNNNPQMINYGLPYPGAPGRPW